MGDGFCIRSLKKRGDQREGAKKEKCESLIHSISETENDGGKRGHLAVVKKEKYRRSQGEDHRPMTRKEKDAQPSQRKEVSGREGRRQIVIF